MNFLGFGRKHISAKPCIVVADDVATIRAIVRGVSSRMGFVTYEAWNGEEALDSARRHQPKLVVMDLAMGGRDGMSALEEFKKDAELSSIPVLILSANTDPGVIARAKEIGALDYVIKDNLPNVTEVIREHLRALGGTPTEPEPGR